MVAPFLEQAWANSTIEQGWHHMVVALSVVCLCGVVSVAGWMHRAVVLMTTTRDHHDDLPTVQPFARSLTAVVSLRFPSSVNVTLNHCLMRRAFVAHLDLPSTRASHSVSCNASPAASLNLLATLPSACLTV